MYAEGLLEVASPSCEKDDTPNDAARELPQEAEESIARNAGRTKETVRARPSHKHQRGATRRSTVATLGLGPGLEIEDREKVLPPTMVERPRAAAKFANVLEDFARAGLASPTAQQIKKELSVFPDTQWRRTTGFAGGKRTTAIASPTGAKKSNAGPHLVCKTAGTRASQAQFAQRVASLLKDPAARVQDLEARQAQIRALIRDVEQAPGDSVPTHVSSFVQTSL